MKAFFLALIFTLCIAGLYGRQCLQGSYWVPTSIVFTIKGTDCVNCYSAATSLYNRFKDVVPLAVITSGVPARYTKHFLETKLSFGAALDTVFADSTIFRCLNETDLSGVSVVSNNIVVYSAPLKEVNYEALSNALYQHSKWDTLDVTPYAGTIQSKVCILTDSIVAVYNDLTNEIVRINHISRKAAPPLSLKALTNNPQLLLSNTPGLTKAEIDFNLNNHQSLQSRIGQRILAYPPYYVADTIWVPVVFRFASFTVTGTDTSIRISPYQYLVRINKSGLPDVVVSFPPTITGSPNLYHQTYGGYIADGNFYMRLSAYLNDSMLARYSLTDSAKFTLQQVYGIGYPSYFPVRNDKGIKKGYQGNFCRINNKLFYYFNVESVLYSLTDTLHIHLKVFKRELFTGNTSNYWISHIQQYSNSVAMFGGKTAEATKMYVFDIGMKELKSVVEVAETPVEVVGISKGQVIALSITDDKVLLLKKRLL